MAERAEEDMLKGFGNVERMNESGCMCQRWRGTCRKGRLDWRWLE